LQECDFLLLVVAIFDILKPNTNSGGDPTTALIPYRS